MVSILLLHAARQPRLRPQLSGGDKALAARDRQVDRLLRSRAERAAQQLVDGGFADRLDYAQQTLSEVPFERWRDFDPEDSLRFFALRLHEVGMITSSPNQILAEGTDWRFLNELKRELKA